MKTLILRLSDNQVKCLCELAEQYLVEGFINSFEISDINALKDSILEATEKTEETFQLYEPLFQLNLSGDELEVLGVILDFYNENRPDKENKALKYLTNRVKSRDLIVLD